MTNKEIIQKVNEGFAENNTEKIMQYVANDVRWDVMGASTAIGKDAFLKEVNNEHFVGLPSIKIKNEIEQNDWVAVEGEVQCMVECLMHFSLISIVWKTGKLKRCVRT
jgi:hypothetical protein